MGDVAAAIALPLEGSACLPPPRLDGHPPSLSPPSADGSAPPPPPPPHGTGPPQRLQDGWYRVASPFGWFLYLESPSQHPCTNDLSCVALLHANTHTPVDCKPFPLLIMVSPSAARGSSPRCGSRARLLLMLTSATPPPPVCLCASRHFSVNQPASCVRSSGQLECAEGMCSPEWLVPLHSDPSIATHEDAAFNPGWWYPNAPQHG